MARTLVVVNRFNGFQATIASLGENLGLPVSEYIGVKGLAADLNSNVLPPESVALLVMTGFPEQHDPEKYRLTMKFIKQFRNKPKYADIPVLFLAQRGDENLAAACTECGVTYLPLPTKKSNILACAAGLYREPEQHADSAPITIGQNDQKTGPEQEEGEMPITIGLRDDETAELPITIGTKTPQPVPDQPPQSADESERRVATVMFADISGFTAMNGKMDPEQELRDTSDTDRMICSELVGRNEEMNELRHILTGLIMGKGGIVNVIGEAGIGKSRLMAELKSGPAMKQVILLEGQAISMGRNLPFHPIIDLLKSWAGIREDDGPAEAFRKLENAVRTVRPTDADDIVSFMGTMMGMKLPGKHAERVKGIEGEALEKLIFKNVRELIIMGSEIRPMIVCIEDLHWADASTVEILTSLFKLAREHRILFLNLFRPNYEETGDRVVKIAKEDFAGTYTEIVVNPLDDDESVTLISNLLKITGLPQSLKVQITANAEGNPFFIEEVVRSLIDDGAVVKKGGSFTVTEKIHGVKVPLTINEVLMNRIDHLDEETRSLIKTASVIGRYFFHKIITDVAQNVSDINQRLSYLEDIQLIRERRRMDELEYLFKHALAQEAAYDSILLQKRRELHLHVAQSIENMFSERLNECYGLLAFHYSKGENLDKAEEYMLRAGEESMKASASNEALEYFKNALARYREQYGNAVDKKKISAFENNIAIAYYNKGRMFEAAPIFRKLLDTFRGKMPRNRMLQIVKSGIGFLHFFVAIYFPTLKFKKIPGEKEKAIIDLFYYRLESIINSDARKFIVEIFEALQFLSKFDLMHCPRAAGMMAAAAGFLSYAGISHVLAKRTITMLQNKIDEADPFCILWFESAKTLYHYHSSEWASWEDYKDSILQPALTKGPSLPLSTYLFWQFKFYLHKGIFNKARHMIDILETIATSYDYNLANLLMEHMKTIYALALRNIEKASMEIEKGSQLAEKLNDEAHHIMFLSFTSELHLLTGDIDSSVRSLAIAHQRLAPVRMPAVQSHYYQAEFRAYLFRMERLLHKDHDTNFGILQKQALRSGKNQLKAALKAADFLTEALMMTGSYWWLLGRTRKAFRWWKKSLDEGERLGAKLELSRSYFEIGRRLLEKPITKRQLRLRLKARALAKKLLGLTPEECLGKAEAMFLDMSLRWDMGQLKEVRDEINFHEPDH